MTNAPLCNICREDLGLRLDFTPEERNRSIEEIFNESEILFNQMPPNNSQNQVRKIKVRLNGEEISPENLPSGFYLYRFERQKINTPPRRTREEMLEIIKKAERNIYLTWAGEIGKNFPFSYLYNKLR